MSESDNHPKKRSLILAGGGVKVAFQAGVLQVWLDVGSNLSQVAVVPGRLDAAEDGRGLGTGAVPADAEAFAVGGIRAVPDDPPGEDIRLPALVPHSSTS
jgi:hypothetical protein